MNYIIYKATSPSGKVYIGLTGTPLYKRKWSHCYQARVLKNKTIFYCALRKYNYEFNWEVIESNLTKEEAQLKEVEYIKTYRSTERQFGYNISSGGEVGTKMSVEGKKRYKEKMSRYYRDPEYIKKISVAKKNSLTDENKKHLSRKLKQFYSVSENKEKFIKNIRLVYFNNKDIRRKQALKKGGKSFYCVETGEIFETLWEASQSTGGDRRAIHDVLKGRAKTCKKLTFKYLKNQSFEIEENKKV